MRSLATTIAAMEFDLQCLDGKGRIVSLEKLNQAEGPFALQVLPEDAQELGEVLHDIIEEQEEFDALLDERERTDKRSRRRLIWLLIIIMILLAVFGLLEL